MSSLAIGGTNVLVAQMSSGTNVGRTNVGGTYVGGTKVASPTDLYKFSIIIISINGVSLVSK